jgi:hypothetical protein
MRAAEPYRESVARGLTAGRDSVGLIDEGRRPGRSDKRKADAGVAGRLEPRCGSGPDLWVQAFLVLYLEV